MVASFQSLDSLYMLVRTMLWFQLAGH
jgi:hypothetical protein